MRILSMDIHQETVDVTSMISTEGDRDWVTTSKCGRDHYWTPRRVANARAVDVVDEVVNDGEELIELTHTEWYCRWCDEQIWPRTKVSHYGGYRQKARGLRSGTIVISLPNGGTVAPEVIGVEIPNTEAVAYGRLTDRSLWSATYCLTGIRQPDRWPLSRELVWV